jgi:hypothetical protein
MKTSYPLATPSQGANQWLALRVPVRMGLPIRRQYVSDHVLPNAGGSLSDKCPYPRTGLTNTLSLLFIRGNPPAVLHQAETTLPCHRRDRTS